MLGARFEAEIREQPAVWRRLATSSLARAYADVVVDGEVVLVGSGSSLCVAELGALALRRRGIAAAAVAASEARFERSSHAPADGGAFAHRTVVALSQSGRSTDVLRALDVLEPARVVALTNDASSPLAARVDVVLDVAAGLERAVPATKTVSAMAAVVLWGAALARGSSDRGPATLAATADAVDAWLAHEASGVANEAARLARCRSVAVVGAGYGVPIARELALKIKEASYLHAEGFAAGEFRHGSSAILDGATALVGVVDDASRAVVARPFAEAARTGTFRLTVGGRLDGVPAVGPPVGEAFNGLAWLVAGQVLALEVGRARGVDGDAPRGLTKFVG
jgi:glucosamine--fructose-6-phosphate aminotransferase (isomerizing)